MLETDNSGIYLIMAQFVIVALVTGILSFAAPHSKYTLVRTTRLAPQKQSEERRNESVS